MPGARIQNLSKFITNPKTLDHLWQSYILDQITFIMPKPQTASWGRFGLLLNQHKKQLKNKPTIWIVNGILHRRDVSPSFVEDVN